MDLRWASTARTIRASSIAVSCVEDGGGDGKWTVIYDWRPHNRCESAADLTGCTKKIRSDPEKAGRGIDGICSGVQQGRQYHNGYSRGAYYSIP